jgi:hypothetical protein
MKGYCADIIKSIKREMETRQAYLPPISLYKSIEGVCFDERNSIFEGSVTLF